MHGFMGWLRTHHKTTSVSNLPLRAASSSFNPTHSDLSVRLAAVSDYRSHSACRNMIHGNHSPVRQIEVDAIHVIGVKGRKSMNLGIQREDVGEESMERCVAPQTSKKWIDNLPEVGREGPSQGLRNRQA